MKYILIVIAGYFLGSINVAIFTSTHMLGGDIRRKGSGNAGATNMARVYGFRAALITLLGDMVKAVASMGLGYLLCGDAGLAAGGIACMIGHCFPVYHGFRGGKGVAAGAAVALMIDWRVFLCCLAVFLLLSLTTKKVSLGSCCAAITAALAAWLFSVSPSRIVLAVCGALLVLGQHRENLKRVLEGTEPDFHAAKGE